MNQEDYLKQLVRRYITQTATEEELALFFQLLKTGELDPYLEQALIEEEPATPVLPYRRAVLSRPVWRVLAAAGLIGIAVGLWFLVRPEATAPAPVAVQSPAASDARLVTPGTTKAVLTLGSGQTLDLGNRKNLPALQEGTARVEQSEEGITYATTSAQKAEALYNTLSTPYGGQYQVTLSDGTKVWLNAGTTLKYPTAFTGTDRRVSLQGEAYFEVAHNPAMPFIVDVKEGQIRVLGTRFNIQSYPDEGGSSTTLTQGSVQLERLGQIALLKPGQQGHMERGAKGIEVKEADVDLQLAWRNGLFRFRKTDLGTIMRQLARWYDLDIRYEGGIPTKRFVGEISRDTRLSEVLKILELSDIRFELKGRVLTVKA